MRIESISIDFLSVNSNKTAVFRYKLLIVPINSPKMLKFF